MDKLYIMLLKQQGEKKAGETHEVFDVVPHGGHSDDSKQYVLKDGTHVLESSARPVYID